MPAPRGRPAGDGRAAKPMASVAPAVAAVLVVVGVVGAAPAVVPPGPAPAPGVLARATRPRRCWRRWPPAGIVGVAAGRVTRPGRRCALRPGRRAAGRRTRVGGAAVGPGTGRPLAA